ncbi:MAG TPA: hypothetical protein VHY48_03535 [Acidobacteriaceae bacterium]|jgi:hypothetical protein|nr:hypothetical protein [Acidobacteriaceae bacterium]
MLRLRSTVDAAGGSCLKNESSVVSFVRHRAAVWVVLAAGVLGAAARAQTCTTQAAMGAGMRQALAGSALALASAIKGNDAARVESMADHDLAANFDATAYIVHTNAAKIANDTLQVTQVYELDASARKTGDTTEAGEVDFACPLRGTTDEVDFAISGLPPGVYGFVMVEAAGDRPWLLSFLLEQQGSGWKMAGIYPHARTAAGHDGLWYWTTARAAAKAGHKWLAWVLYDEADQLLRPANFATSTHLDELRAERHTNAPSELSDGVSEATPLVIQGRAGAEFHVIDLGSAGTDDGKGMDLILHYKAETLTDPAAETARNAAAAGALLAAHPELREDFTGISVFAETEGRPPFATELGMGEVK